MWHQRPEDRCFHEEPVLQSQLRFAASHELHWRGPGTGSGTFTNSLPPVCCFIKIASMPASSVNTGQVISNQIELPLNENWRGCCGHLTSHQWHASPLLGQPFPHESNLDTLIRLRMHRKPLHRSGNQPTHHCNQADAETSKTTHSRAPWAAPMGQATEYTYPASRFCS